MCAPIGLETEKGTRLLVHPSRAVEVVSRVLCIPLYDTTWEKGDGEEESPFPWKPGAVAGECGDLELNRKRSV